MAAKKKKYDPLKVKTAALYSRLSRDDGADAESNSVQTQKVLLEYAAKGKGYIHCIHYTDDGISGVTMNRPGLQKMIGDIEAGKIGAVFVKDSSRLGRNNLGVGRLLEEVFPYYDVRFVSVSEGIDTDKGEDEMMPFRSIINEQYAKDISRKRKSANKVKGMAGIPLSAPPYGYMKNPDNPKFWVVDEEAAAVVRRIFKLTLEGMGTQEIANLLDDEDVLTPLNYWAKKGMPRGGNANSKNQTKWNSSTIVGILAMQEYCGDVINFKTFSKSVKDKRRWENDPENIMVFKDTHDPVIDRDIYEKIQEKRGKMRKRKKTDGGKNIFSGLLVCADCGHNLNYHFNQGNHDIRYYNCSNNNSGRGDCTDTHYIRLDFLEKVVMTDLKHLMQFARNYENEFAYYMMDCAVEAVNTDRNLMLKELNALYDRDHKLDQLFETLYEDNVDGKISNERFSTLSTKYELEQAEVREKAKALQRQFDEFNDKAVTVEGFLRSVQQYTRMKKLTARILNELIEKIEVHQAKKIDGIWVQKLTIHYHCVGALDVPDLEKAPFKRIEMSTRKGVSIRNAPPSENMSSEAPCKNAV